eukprot:CAMPEP_0177686050 /NCGR_PEP_ID=MMETSP0447-20121125/33355_1 /TAXON_ID=0 /ORGANISM="Stygamoeba regulata, Strain BSH-02190019" /LENGTH=714 /DNA_ID=CAMNT_0019196133 /DNA_START=196 /DNA_END=2337 /DNA_ORIENTATION=-
MSDNARADIEDVIDDVALSGKLSGVAVSSVKALLEQHWIATLEDWAILTPCRKRRLGIPLNLIYNLDTLALPRVKKKEVLCEIIRHRAVLSCRIQRYSFRISEATRVSELLAWVAELEDRALDREDAMFTLNNVRADPKSYLISHILPLSRLLTPQRTYVFKANYHMNAVDRWLHQHDLERHSNLLYVQMIDDFLLLPFLTGDILDRLGFGAIAMQHDRVRLLSLIDELRAKSPCEFFALWMTHLGFPDVAPALFNEGFDLRTALTCTKEELERICYPDAEAAAAIFGEFERYRRFSSVEATWDWLRSMRFEKYAFHFARYNIPFYALPYVHFPVFGEVAANIPDATLCTALNKLRDSPAYRIRVIPFWLRDLELEHYNVEFARRGLSTLEDMLPYINGECVDDVIVDAQDMQRYAIGLRELNEFQYYYHATSALLRAVGMGSYSQLVATNGLSMEDLPNITDAALVRMGVACKDARARILAVCADLRKNFPKFLNKENGSDGAGRPPEFFSSVGGTACALPKLSLGNLSAECEAGLAKYVKDCLNEKPSASRNGLGNTNKKWEQAFINDDSRPVIIRPSSISNISLPDDEDVVCDADAHKTPSSSRKARRRRNKRRDKLHADAQTSEDVAGLQSEVLQFLQQAAGLDVAALGEPRQADETGGGQWGGQAGAREVGDGRCAGGTGREMAGMDGTEPGTGVCKGRDGRAEEQQDE